MLNNLNDLLTKNLNLVMIVVRDAATLKVFTASDMERTKRFMIFGGYD